MNLLFDAPERPIRFLTYCFLLWKTLLFISILASPGPGYDTSTLLVDSSELVFNASKTVQNHAEWSPPRIYKLLRWDAVYFAEIARRGRQFEQEWAFGYGYTKVLSWYTTGLTSSGLTSSKIPEILAGAALATTCHFLSVIVLYKLSRRVFSSKSSSLNRQLSFIAAALHIINPAGAFLVAPYSEPVFSLLNFTGCYLFLDGFSASRRPLEHGLKVLLAGILFGLATTLRSNGILSGILFAQAAAVAALEVLKDGITQRAVQRLSFLICGGSFIALGAIYPQYAAYLEYCGTGASDENLRPWCKAVVPSIYRWVQSHYWNNGFLRYWTISNLPLFGLAAPMLCILFQSSLWTFRQRSTPTREQSSNAKIKKKASRVETGGIFDPAARSFVVCLALIQAILTFMTFTSAHVQIITRVASGYPLWYWWLTVFVSEKSIPPAALRRGKAPEWIVKWMVIYGAIQAGLFASFLPPA